jgi:hypothetical protein
MTQIGHGSRQSAPAKQIIVVHKVEELSACFPNTAIARLTDAAILLPDYFYARIFRRPVATDLARAVR